MRHQNKLDKVMAELGYQRAEIRGFIEYTREHKLEGVMQGVKIFQWSNPKHANRTTTPLAYYCVDVSISGIYTSGRYRIPLVEWEHGGLNPKPEDQAYRPFEDVFEELYRVILRLHVMPTQLAYDMLGFIPERNIL